MNEELDIVGLKLGNIGLSIIRRFGSSLHSLCHAPNPRIGGRKGAKLYWDSSPAFSNISGPKSYN